MLSGIFIFRFYWIFANFHSAGSSFHNFPNTNESDFSQPVTTIIMSSVNIKKNFWQNTNQSGALNTNKKILRK